VRTAARLAALERWIADSGANLRAAHAVAVLPAEQAVILGAEPGRPASRSAVDLGRVGEALAVLHGAPEGLLADAPRPLKLELSAVDRAAQHIDVLLPGSARSFHRILGRAAELDAELPDERHVSLHGDCKLDHFLRDGGVIAVIDLDRCRPGPASADLGKLLADIGWLTAGFDDLVPEAARTSLLLGHAAAGGVADASRVRLYEAVFTLKAAARRVPLWHPDWEPGVRRLVASAERALNSAVGERRELAGVAR
jgi:aminoglycoside phosphotransferase (APT) family kinase protein